MPRTIDIDQASGELRGLVRALQPGEEIVLTDHDERVARIVADARPAPLPADDLRGRWKGKLTILDDGDDVVLDHFKDYLP